MSQATAQLLEGVSRDFIPENELVWSDGAPLDTIWHRKQINLAADVLEEALAERGVHDGFVGGNMFVYYSAEQARAIAEEVRQMTLFGDAEVDVAVGPSGRKPFKGPDVFVVTGGVKPRRRRTAVMTARTTAGFGSMTPAGG